MTQMSILVVDDEGALRDVIALVLKRANFDVETADSGAAALEILEGHKHFDAIITDLQMPGMKGIELLSRVRERNLDLPVILLTGHPTIDSAVSAVQYGAFRYISKPFKNDELVEVVRSATSMHRLAVLKRKALEFLEGGGWLIGDAAGLEAHFEGALENLWIAFQPIVQWPTRSVYGYEALVRSTEPTLNNPGLLIEAAERLGRLQELGRAIRAKAALRFGSPFPANTLMFVNLHAADLEDEELFARSSPLSAYAEHVVLEITERASLHRIKDVGSRVAALRRLGYRIAVDDLGAGYAGLSSFSQLEPDIAKLDMSLIRGIDSSPMKASLVRSMISVCRDDLRTKVVCEGVETPAERDTLEGLGADLLQGFLFAKPQPQFRSTSIFAPAPAPASN